MCGRFYTSHSAQSTELFRTLGIYGEAKNNSNVSPTDSVHIVVPGKRERQLATANWWLAMKANDHQELIPNTQWQTFNTRADKILNSPLHRFAPRSFRVVIPAAGYYEWQNGRPIKLNLEQGDIAFGGLAKYWPEHERFSCSIITLPGHPALAHIHKKSVPLMLRGPQLEHWLDRSLSNAEVEHVWQNPQAWTLEAQAVKSPKEPELIGEKEVIKLTY